MHKHREEEERDRERKITGTDGANENIHTCDDLQSHQRIERVEKALNSRKKNNYNVIIMQNHEINCIKIAFYAAGNNVDNFSFQRDSQAGRFRSPYSKEKIQQCIYTCCCRAAK